MAWTAGTLAASFTNAVSAATLNSIANGNAILSDLQIDNTSALDEIAVLSVAMGSITIAAPNYIGIYLYPLNKDATTYGDGRFSAAAAGPPGANYYWGQIIMPTGAAASEGSCSGLIPPLKFKFVFYNQLGATWAGSAGNTAQFQTFNP